MKRVILFAFALLTIGSAFAQTVSVNDVYVRPGETAQFAVDVTIPAGKENTYTAMTLYAQFPATGFTTTGAYTVSSSWVGASTTVGNVNNTGLATIPFASSNAIPGSVDNLVSVSFTVDANVDCGDYNVTLGNTMFEYNTSDKDYAANVTFKVHVTNKVVLDENSPFAPQAYNYPVDVLVKRTINANEWSTICLPFAMTAEQLSSAFGPDAEMAYFSSYSTTNEGSDVTGISVILQNNPLPYTLYANYPYVIKTTHNISEFELTTTINPKDVVAKYTTGSGPGEVIHGSFIGTYQAKTIVPANSLFINGNKFYYSAGKTKMKGFRAYFTLNDVLTEVASASTRITVSFDNDAAGINEVKRLNNDAVYNLNGQRVESTKKGLYIQNGKKVIIK